MAGSQWMRARGAVRTAVLWTVLSGAALLGSPPAVAECLKVGGSFVAYGSFVGLSNQQLEFFLVNPLKLEGTATVNIPAYPPSTNLIAASSLRGGAWTPVTCTINGAVLVPDQCVFDASRYPLPCAEEPPASSPPTGGSCSASPSETLPGGTPITLQASGWTDLPLNLPLQYAWKLEGTILGAGASITTPSASLVAGRTYVFSLTVTNAQGLSASCETNPVLALSPSEALDRLEVTVAGSGGIEAELKGALSAKLEAASDSLARGNVQAAAGQLSATANQLQAQADKKAGSDEVVRIIRRVEELVEVLKKE